ncbi:hypothetical protein KW790_01085 [Candidatus Parcubacteria bacterium]|nr:hypothetical protein [Candidatus Parcubacteria bacterium]
MNTHNYYKVSGFIFLLVAVLHLWRLINGLTVKFGTYMVPTWLSWAAVIVAGYLAYTALLKKK